MLNLHHLELFHYVARFGGVTQAVRRMPYGITQSALSRQMIEFEEQVGTTLFQRRPFALTPAGTKLYEFTTRLFDELKGLAEELRAGVPDLVRIAASPIVLRDYLPSILLRLEAEFKGLRYTLQEGLQSQIDEWFQARQIDLAITMLEGEAPHHCLSKPLLRLPMVLLVPAASPVRSATELWKRRPRIAEKLISPQSMDAVSRCFRQGLQRQGVNWPIGVTVNSIELVEAYVAKGVGFGISVIKPGRPQPPGVRALPLSGFPRICLGMIWSREPNPVTKALMSALEAEAQAMRQLKLNMRRGA